MCAFQSHPSVRIKGTENEFEPVSCMNMNCAKKMHHHWHCPLCQKADVYCDPLILKAHFRVKHVDKGIEFAGLKILRCCQKCEIVGTIKGCKDFKSAHWHCYRCRNGFNRRDEAFKHFKTHFRNPQTTFQIQIAQDINAAGNFTDSQEAGNPGMELLQISPVDDATEEPSHLETEYGGKRVQTINMKISPMGELHTSVAAEETVDSTGATEGQTVIIIEHTGMNDDNQGSSSPGEEVMREPSHDMETVAMATFEEGSYSVNLLEERESYMKQVEQLQTQVENLKAENSSLEEKLSGMQEELEKQNLAAQKREHNLLQQLMQPLPERTMTLFNQLKADHEALLHSHLQAVQQVSESEAPFPNYVQVKETEAPMFIVESIKSDGEQETGDAEEATIADEKPEDPEGKRKVPSSPSIVVKKLRFDL